MNSLLHTLAHSRSYGQQTPLHQCTTALAVRVLSLLCHADLESSSARGDTPLLLAAYERREDAVRELIRHGANIDACDDARCSVLLASVIADDVSVGITAMLLEAGADVDHHDGDASVIVYACRYLGYPTVELLVRWGADTSVRYRGSTLISLVQKRVVAVPSIVKLLRGLCGDEEGTDGSAAACHEAA